MNISAIRHNPTDGSSSDSESEDGERSPWPEYEIDRSSLPTSYTRSSPADHQRFEWINRRGVSRVYNEIPVGQQPRTSIFGRDTKSAFDDFPEPPEDLSSGDDDFPAHIYKPVSRPDTPSDPCLERRSPASNHRTAPSSPSTSLYPLFPVHDSSYHQSQRSTSMQASRSTSFDHDRDVLEDSENQWQDSQGYDVSPPRSPSAHAAIAASASEEENGLPYRNARRKGKQLFYENEEEAYESAARQYLNMSAAPSPRSSEHSRDMSVKAKGKQRVQEDVDDANIPNAQMSDLRLHNEQRGVDKSRKLASTSQGAANEAGKETGRSRSSTVPSYENNDGNSHEHVSARPRSSSSQSLPHRRATNTPSAASSSTHRHSTSRTGKRPVSSDSEEREWDAQDESAEPQPTGSGKPPSGKKRKVNRYPCPVPWCKETFTRRNDVRRHVKNAAVHRDSPEALALLGEANDAGTRCKFCNADLSRADARMRHERASACGKRTTQKMKDQMLLMRA